MKLPTFKTKDEIPEAFRSGYVERNGEWVPDVEDVAGLKSAQQRALDEKKKIEAQLSSLLGNRKPEEVAEILKGHESAEEKRQREAGDFDKLLEKRLAERDAEWQKKFDGVAPFKTKYEDKELETAIRDAATKAGVTKPASMKLLLDATKGKSIRLDEKTGKPVVYDADGDATGLSLEKYFSDGFKAEYPLLYEGTGGSGGGAPGNGGGAGKGGSGTIAISDTAGFLANVDKVAKGEVKVTAA